MKKTAIILCMVLLCATTVLADEVDLGLPKQTAHKLEANTREMIKLGVKGDDAIKMTRLMVENRFQVETAIQAQEIVMNAKKQGLPEGPVINKALEGIAKQVQAGGIVQAMEKTRARYAYAYEKARTLQGNPEETALTGDVIAEGMAAGLIPQDVDTLCDRLQTRDRIRDKLGDEDGTKDQTRDRDRDRIHQLAQESFMAAREMTRTGVPSDVATDAVCQALENSYQASEMQQLRRAFMTGARNGDPAQLAKSYAYAIRNGATADDLGTAARNGQGWSDGTAGSGMSGGQGHIGGGSVSGGTGGSDSGAGGSSRGGSGGGSGSGSGGSGGRK